MSGSLDYRKYQPIWHQLKSLPRDKASLVGVSITAPRVMHKRIFKAVQKEKWMDVGYKLQIEPRKAIMTRSRNGSILTFYLQLSLCADDF